MDWLFSTNLSTVGFTLDQIKNKNKINWKTNVEISNDKDVDKDDNEKSKKEVEDDNKKENNFSIDSQIIP